MRLDEIDVGAINRFRARLLEMKLSKKRINNILAVLSKALRYADDVKLISAPRKIGLLKFAGSRGIVDHSNDRRPDATTTIRLLVQTSG